jgi:hypothetical protein
MIMKSVLIQPLNGSVVKVTDVGGEVIIGGENRPGLCYADASGDIIITPFDESTIVKHDLESAINPV